MVLGDTHGNADWLRYYVFPTAMALEVDAIVQVGDYGFWEHEPAGVRFNDEVDDMAETSGIPLYWLRGNHDKSSLAWETYGDFQTDDGFVVVRKNVFFIPDGLLWAWQGRTFRAFGGAYSVDKSWRLNREKRIYEMSVTEEEYKASKENRQPKFVKPTAGTLWFPEEEMTDEDMQRFLDEDSSQLDFVFSHDKPRQTNPGWNRKDLPLCLPNQQRLQRALEAHEPSYWFHGHLHHHYVQHLRGPRAERITTVISLDPDSDAAEMNWSKDQTWALIDLGADVNDTLVRLGTVVKEFLDPEDVEKALKKLTDD